jgi:transposase
MKVISALTLTNQNGGFYECGRHYGLAKKREVALAFFQLREENPPCDPSVQRVAERAKVGWHYADSVIKELRDNGESLANLIDPAIIHHQKTTNDGEYRCFLSPEEEMFLLSMRAEDGRRPNISYIHQLFLSYGRVVSSSFISLWFHKRFGHSGRFKKPNLVPLDKFKNENIIKYHDYIDKMERLPDKTKFHFLDEKHLVNKDVLANKTRADPLTGYMDAILVSGDFREAYNLLAIISGNPSKPSPIHYVIGKENGNSTSFAAYIMQLISNRWFEHGDVLVLDNAAIHSGGDAGNVEDYLWDTVVDGRPLNVLVIFLPTRSPELNPIELVFHILARRIRSFRYRMAGPCDNAVVHQTTKVLDAVSYETVLKCYAHCGY